MFSCRASKRFVITDKLLAYAADVGAFIGGSETVPGFGDYYGFGNEGYVFVWSLDGSGRSGAEYVLVLGHVFNDITAESGIKKSDFYGDISNMTCYYIKQVAE